MTSSPLSPDLNIASHLPRMAALEPDSLAVVVQSPGPRYTEHTLRELDAASSRMAHGLRAYGVEPGMRTVLMVKPSFPFFALTFALFKIGAIPVMVDPGMGLPNLKTCLEEARPEAFIGIPKAHVGRLLYGWAKGSLRKLVTVGPRLFWGGASLGRLMSHESDPYLVAPVELETVAAILFTSGSTGVPKGAVYTHGIFNAQVALLRDAYGIQPGERDIATFPLFALFGPALGMAAIVPDMDATRPAQADPRKLIHAIHTYNATNMFGSPALLDALGRYGEANGVRLPSLKRIVSAGAPVAIPSLRRVAAMLPDGVEVWPSYGATEALPIATIGSRELFTTEEATAQGGGVCVGRALPGVQIAVIPITDTPIPEWRDDLLLPVDAIGEIAVSGAMVTREYYQRPDHTTLSKILDPARDAYWHRMGDVGRMDAAGRLWMCGRKSHRVETPAGVLFTIPCERVFNTHPKVRRTALVGVGESNERLPVLCVELESGAPDAVIQELRVLGAANPITAPIRHFLIHPAFPVDIRHNAKIFREKLAVWAAMKMK